MSETPIGAKIVKEPESVEFQHLGDDCGHHCCAQAAAHGHVNVVHCNGCHNSPDKEVCDFDKEVKRPLFLN